MRKLLLPLLLATGCATVQAPDVCEGMRLEIDQLERRVEELESQLSLCQGDSDAAYTDLDECLEKLEVGSELAEDLIHRLDIMEEHDAQRERLRDWAGGPEVPEL